jgi:hypothetical protein
MLKTTSRELCSKTLLEFAKVDAYGRKVLKVLGNDKVGGEISFFLIKSRRVPIGVKINTANLFHRRRYL